MKDTLLFVGKCIGVIMPAMLIGWGFLLLLAVAAILSLAAGRLLFHRDRLLT